MSTRLKAAVVVGVTALASTTLVACGSSGQSGSNAAGNSTGSGGSSGSVGTISFLSVQNTSTGYTKIFNDLSKAYTKQNHGVKFSVQTVQQTNIDQKLQLEAASGSLPNMFNVNNNSLEISLGKSGKILDMGATLKSLGIYNKLVPAAIGVETQEHGGKLYSLPLELNIEGFWYNKEMFSKYNLTPPTTWSQMLQDAKVLQSHNIQPFAVDGVDGWPITRLIGGYAIRYYGANAMKEVSDGTLQLTDPGFVKAAQTVQTMAKDGYFGKGVDSVDYNTALGEFLDGKAAMYYMGSWELRDFNNSSVDKIGESNIGLFNIPLVQGGKGKSTTWEMNTGISNAFSQSGYNAAEKKWMKYVLSNYGNTAMNELGQISGFKVDKLPSNTTPLTKSTINTISAVKQGALWFEAFFDQKTQSLSYQGAQELVNNQITPQAYMSELQQSLNAAKQGS